MENEAIRIRLKMKISRSSKLYFSKWLTIKKKTQVKEFLQEYSLAVNFFINKYQDYVPEMKKFDLLKALYIQNYIETSKTWLTARAVKNAFSEGYGMLQSYKSNLENNKKHKLPFHTSKKAILSETIIAQYLDETTKTFDFGIKIGSIGKKQKIHVPLKRHKQFNKWYSQGKIAK